MLYNIKIKLNKVKNHGYFIKSAMLFLLLSRLRGRFSLVSYHVGDWSLSYIDLFLHFLFKIIWIFTLTFIFNNSRLIFFLRFLGLVVFDLDLVFTVSVLFCLYFFILFFQNLILFKFLQILILLLWVMLLYFFFYFAFDLRNLLFLSFYWILALLIIL